MPRRERYLWVCQNERAPGHPKGCCRERGSAEVLDRLRAGLAERGLHRRSRAMSSGCMDLCWVGPSVAVMPDGVFYGRVRPEDVPELLDSLEQGTLVERLIVPEEEFVPPEARTEKKGKR